MIDSSELMLLLLLLMLEFNSNHSSQEAQLQVRRSRWLLWRKGAACAWQRGSAKPIIMLSVYNFLHIIKYTRLLSGQGGRRRRRRWQCNSHPTSCNEHNSSAPCSVITLPGQHLVVTSESISSEWSLLICFLIGDTKPRPFAAFRLCYRIYSKAFTRTVYY